MSKSSKRRGQNPQSVPSTQPSGQQPFQIPANGNSTSPGHVVVAQATSSSMSFSGPLPPPSVLKEYDKVLVGAAERIFKMAEAQANHRQELEKRVVKSDILKSYLGLGAGFLIATLAIIGGSIVANNGQPWAGAAIGGAPVAALVWAFLKGTSARREEREAKTREMQQIRNS